MTINIKELDGEPDFTQSMDASLWAKAFVEMHGGDEDLMLGWFANAIMRGYDSGTPQLDKQAEQVRVLREALGAIGQYGSDTLSGPINGNDDRKWQRDAVLEMTKRAQQALAATQEGE